MNKLSYAIILALFVFPIFVSASWWNPTTWFKKSVPVPTVEVPVVESKKPITESKPVPVKKKEIIIKSKPKPTVDVIITEPEVKKVETPVAPVVQQVVEAKPPACEYNLIADPTSITLDSLQGPQQGPLNLIQKEITVTVTSNCEIQDKNISVVAQNNDGTIYPYNDGTIYPSSLMLNIVNANANTVTATTTYTTNLKKENPGTYHVDFTYRMMTKGVDVTVSPTIREYYYTQPSTPSIKGSGGTASA